MVHEKSSSIFALDPKYREIIQKCFDPKVSLEKLK